mgnify:FL=1
MAKTEETLLMVKPDGIDKGLVPIIRRLLIQSGLTVRQETNFLLEERFIKELYKEYMNRDYFPTLLQFLISQNVVVFLVEGENAISAVRGIIGKRVPPHGLRAHYAEDIVRNIAHGPDSPEAAVREIKLFFGKE